MGDFYFMNIFSMINTKCNIFVWVCRCATITYFCRYCKKYIMMHNSVMLVIMETRYNPSNLYNTFKQLGYDRVLYMSNQGYA